MQWKYQFSEVNEQILEPYVGFVYMITNLTNQKKYIGKKLLRFKKTKIVKGRKRKFLIDSDWKRYWGSNKNLIADVKDLGEDKFCREILRLCLSRSECNYFELKYQIDLGVMESDQFYNEWILARINKIHLKKIDFSKN